MPIRRHALIIGGSGAIGRATADALRADGWDVTQTSFMAYIENSPTLDMRSADFSDWVKNYPKSIDALVFASGINEPGPLETITADSFDRVVAVNARGPLLFCKAIWPHLPDGASIVFIGSCSGQVGGPITPHYAMSKAALTALTKNLARLGAPRGIRVNNVAPGWVEGEWVKKAPVEIPLGRLCKASEVADLVSLLVSDSGSYITGQTIGINGGAHFSD